MTRTPERNQYDAAFEVVRGFLRKWDAIGVYQPADSEDGDWPPDEYDSYIPQVLSLLKAGLGADRISSHLAFARTQQMGLPPNPARDRACAETIEAWWKEHSTGG